MDLQVVSEQAEAEARRDERAMMTTVELENREARRAEQRGSQPDAG